MIGLTYPEVIEAHRQKTAAYIARDYKVATSQVQFVGELRWRNQPLVFVCENHTLNAMVDAPETPLVCYQRPPIVELVKEYEHLDPELNRRTNVMTGQCPECGNVLMAEIN